MADKGFGIKELNLIGAAGVPTIESPNNLNLNAVNVAISTHVSVGDSLKVGTGFTAHAGVVTATTFDGTATTATTAGTATTSTYAGSWVLGASGSDHYTFTGSGLTGTVNDPDITLQRGQKYIFKNRSGGHPFRIQDTYQQTGGANAYNNGVTNNSGGDGTDIIFEVPQDAPDTLYYQCSMHPNMGGKLSLGRSSAAKTEVSPDNVSEYRGRNMLINGVFQINQRVVVSATVNSSSQQWPVDRWTARGEGGSKTYSLAKTSIADQGVGARYSLKATSSQAFTASSGDIFRITQCIEGVNIQRLNLGEAKCSYMSLSFTVRSSVAGTHSGAVGNGARNRCFPFSYTLAANTWTDVHIIIPPTTSGSFPETPGQPGLRVGFDLGTGDNYRSTAGAWTSSHAEGATGAVRPMETNGATWEVTKVQLEEGTSKTPYEHRLFSQEMDDCQRYYEKSYPYATAPGSAGDLGRYSFFFNNQGSGYSGGTVRWRTQKCKTPSVTSYATDGTSGQCSVYVFGSSTNHTGVTVQYPTDQGVTFYQNGTNCDTFANQWVADASIP